MTYSSRAKDVLHRLDVVAQLAPAVDEPLAVEARLGIHSVLDHLLELADRGGGGGIEGQDGRDLAGRGEEVDLQCVGGGGGRRS